MKIPDPEFTGDVRQKGHGGVQVLLKVWEQVPSPGGLGRHHYEWRDVPSVHPSASDGPFETREDALS